MKMLNNLNLLYADFQDGNELMYERCLESEVQKVHTTSQNIYEAYLQIQPDVLVIELSIPKSIELVQKIRKNNEEICFIALTKHSSIEVLRKVVDLSFSSYLIKPASREQLIDGLLKTVKRLNNFGRVRLPNYCVWDSRTKTLMHKNNVVALTKREARLFDLLVQRQGRFCNEMQIFYFVWGNELDKVVSNASIRTLVKNLRKKLPDGLITNQYGVGYRLSV